MRWAILYAGGTEVQGDADDVGDVNRWGVMAVIQADEASGARWEASPVGHWGWRDGAWVGFEDHMGFYDYLGNHRGPIVPLFGRTLKDENWEREVRRITERVMEIRKSGWRKRERRP